MLSIKKHLDQPGGNDEVRQALRNAVAETLGAIGERVPCADPDRRKRLAFDLGAHQRRIRELKEAEAIRQTAQKAIEAMADGWDQFASTLKEREHGLTEIIGLLAETASRLDSSNSDFYRGLRYSVKGLEEVGRIENIAALREALQDRLGTLEDNVDRQEAETRESWDGLQQGLDKARSEAKSMSQLVNTSSLGALPTRKHAEQLLTELSERRQPFVVAAVALGDFKDLARRYGDGQAREIVGRMTKRFQADLPADFQLYQWDERTIAAIVERGVAGEVGRQLAGLSRELRKSSVNESDPELRDLRFEPRFGVHAAAKSEGLQSLVKRIEKLAK